MTDLLEISAELYDKAKQAEDALIGAVLTSPAVLAGLDLSPADFVTKNAQQAWQAITQVDMAGPVDLFTVGTALSDLTNGRDWAVWLSERARNTPSAANARAYANELRKMRQKLLAMRACSNAIGAIADGGPDAIDALIGELMDLMSAAKNYEYTIKDSLRAATDLMDRAHKGELKTTPTGLLDLDEMLGGFHDSDLVVIGARPAMGKSALLLNLALNADVPVGIISSEQPHEQIGMRTLAIGSGVGLGKIRAGRMDETEWTRLPVAMAKYSNRGIFINDRSGISIVELVRQARQWKHGQGIHALYVDYIQRIKSSDPTAKRHEQVGEVVRALKELARDLNIPVVALAQVSRDVDKRADKRPNMGDLSDSSEIEKEADQVMTLYRDEVYNPDSQFAGVMEINIEKNRHGPTGSVNVVWNGASQRVRDMERRYTA
ncbi:replicative DNA helicase [Alloalcanivorax xenomutans]|uniref:replicative DNA helicase n=1 Tax=Alloalcanivorax xenomutans TaxID=1094342 RepID=UPI003D9B864A